MGREGPGACMTPLARGGPYDASGPLPPDEV